MSHKGTLEWYRFIFMNEGLREMIAAISDIMKESNNPASPERLDKFIKGILYGANPDGTVRTRPPEPNMNDLGKGHEGQDKYKFESKVWKLWIAQRNKGE